MNKLPTIIITVKNRLDHFLKTFPFNVSQIGVDYRLLYVDYDSEDNLVETIKNEIYYRKDMFSENLKQIRLVRLNKNEKYDIRRAKNLGAAYAIPYSSILAISDADTMFGMDYLKKWCGFVEEGKSFVTNRIQESKAAYPKRIHPTVNYGNIVVSSNDFKKVKGYDETSTGWGGDDDDLFHRLKILGLREINPYSTSEASQYSIMHSDDLRFKDTLFPDMIKPDKKGIQNTQNNVYKNKNRATSLKANYLQLEFINKISNEEVLYEKQ